MALTTDLVSYYKLDENAASTTVADSEGSNTGTASTNTANLYDASGKINSAFDFDGSSEDVTLANESNFDFDYTEPFSVQAWFKSTSNSMYKWMVSKQANSGNYEGWYLGFGATAGKIEWNLDNNGAPSGAYVIRKLTTSTFNDGDWHHVIGTYNGNGLLSGLNIYVDGSLQGVTTHSTGTPSTILNNLPVTIGSRDGSAFFGMEISMKWEYGVEH